MAAHSRSTPTATSAPAGSDRGAAFQAASRSSLRLPAGARYPRKVRRTAAIVAFLLASLTLVWYSVQPGAKIGWSEALAFITGAICVWMTVFENVWNFPIGIANNVFFIVLFFEKRLYADFGLQFLYIALALQGWYLWLYGGTNRTELHVTRASRSDALQTAVLVLVGLPALMLYLQKINGAAPFLDALITVLSVVAQVLLNRKRLENWFVWMAVDVVSVGLFLSKGLYLTAFLYTLFFVLCLRGYREWRLKPAYA